MPRALLVIPTYNEADNLPSLLEAIAQAAPELHIAVMDDGSPDDTAGIAERLLASRPECHVVRRAGPRGYGRACLEGFHLALQERYDYILTMDADWSHDPKNLPQILDALQSGSDLVIGSRYCNGVSVVNWPLRRVLLSVFANSYVRAILRLPVSDCTSGYRGYTARALRVANLARVVSDGYAFLVEIATRVYRAGLQLQEVPIIFIERRAGQSKMSKRVMFESALVPWRLRFTRLHLDRSALEASPPAPLRSGE